MGILFGLQHFCSWRCFIPLPKSSLLHSLQDQPACKAGLFTPLEVLGTPQDLALPVFWNPVWDQWGPQKLKIRRSIPMNKALAVWLRDLAMFTADRAGASTDGGKKWINIKNDFVPQFSSGRKRWDSFSLIHFRGHWGKTDKHHLGFSWIPGTNSRASYHFHITIFQPWQIWRTRNRDISWAWVRPANKLIKCPIAIYSWGEKQIKVLQKVVRTMDNMKPFCTAPGNLQATPE